MKLRNYHYSSLATAYPTTPSLAMTVCSRYSISDTTLDIHQSRERKKSNVLCVLLERKGGKGRKGEEKGGKGRKGEERGGKGRQGEARGGKGRKGGKGEERGGKGRKGEERGGKGRKAEES